MWKVGDWQVKGEDKIELPVPNFRKIHPASEVKYYQDTIEDEYR